MPIYPYHILGILGFASVSLVLAQVSLTEVSQSLCIGNISSGTATYSTDIYLPTGMPQRIPAGDFWDQGGAVWEFSTDTPGVKFGYASIPGEGAIAIPQADMKAIVIDDSSTVWRLSVPSSSVGEFDIVFGVATASVSTPTPSSTVASANSPFHKAWTANTTSMTANMTSVTANTTSIIAITTSMISTTTSMTRTTSTAAAIIATNTAVAKRRREPSSAVPLPLAIKAERQSLVGAKFRRASPAPTAPPAGQYHLIITGKYPCINAPGFGLQPQPTSTGTSKSDPSIMSACSQNSISANSAAWSAYGVNNYLSSILSAAAPTPTEPWVDAGQLLTTDIGWSTECQYNINCAPILCKNVRDNSIGNELLVQRFLAYTAYINFSNYFYSLWNALFNAATLGVGSIDDITTTFFTSQTPDASWEQLFGLLNPLLTVVGVAIAPLIADEVVGVMASVVNEVVAVGYVSNLGPLMDQRYTEAGKISSFVTTYLKTLSGAIQTGYQRFIGNATSTLWCGNALGDRNGIFGTGFWVDSNHMNNFQSNLYNSFVKTLAYKMINYAWNDSNAFIIYVPYDVKIRFRNQTFGQVDRSYCQSLQVNDQEKALIACDGMDGMARIFNGNGGRFPMDSPVLGWDSNYQIVSNEAFNVSAAIMGSVASWKTGDFGYDVSHQYADALTSGVMDKQTAIQLGSLVVSETTAGYFNIPVCRVYDLESFPPDAAAAGEKSYGCACRYNSASGGTPRSTTLFADNVGLKVMQMLSPVPISSPEVALANTYDVCGAQQYDGS